MAQRKGSLGGIPSRGVSLVQVLSSCSLRASKCQEEANMQWRSLQDPRFIAAYLD